MIPQVHERRDHVVAQHRRLRRRRPRRDRRRRRPRQAILQLEDDPLRRLLADAGNRGEPREIAALDRVNFIISNIRLAIALAGAVLLWLAFVRWSISPWWPCLAWLTFAVLAVIHAKRLQRFERAKAAERVYLRGLDRLHDRWAGTGRDGAPFLAGHSYAGDLDLFGPGSLFELLNTARTEIGEVTLADWLRGPAPLPDVAQAMSNTATAAAPSNTNAYSAVA